MPASLRISELNQVTTLSDGDLFLVTDASESTSKKLTLLALKQDLFSGNSFSSFNDVDLTTSPPTDGQFLRYNAAEDNWQAGDISLSSLGTLSDVDLISNPPLTGETIIWDGTKFVPGEIDLSPINSALGIPEGQTHLGVFTGHHLTDDQNIKQLLQVLSNAITSEQATRTADVDQEEASRIAAVNTINTTIASIQNTISNLDIDLSPETLNSINELSAALQDNPDIITNLQSADTALSGRLDTLESDPTTATALAAVQADVNQNEADADASFVSVASEQTVQDNRLTALETDVANLDVGLAPEALNTINELANALGDNPDAITNIQNTLNKLVPPAPTTLAGLTVTPVTNAGSARLCVGFTDRTANSGGHVVGDTVLRNTDGSVSTELIEDVGPGDSGQVSAKISTATYDVATTMSSGTNAVSALGLEISDNKDASLSTRDSGIQAGFYQVYDIRLVDAGLNNQVNGLHEISFTQSGQTTAKGYFYEDSSTVGAPTLTFSSLFMPVSPNYSYSSGIAHYNSSADNTFHHSVIVGNASGDMYTSDNLVTTTPLGYDEYGVANQFGTVGFTDPGNKTYVDFGGTLPPAKDFAVGSTVFTASNFQPKDIHATISSDSEKFIEYTVTTPYGTVTGRPTHINKFNIMGNTSRTDVMDEDNILISNVGSGSGNATRVGELTGDNPVPSHVTWDSSAAPAAHEAIVRGGVLRNDLTDYSTGYFPTGLDLSSRSNDPQYFTVELRRSDVSQFNINYSGTCAGCWVVMPDNSSWNTSLSGSNGWADMFQAYRGAGIPTNAEPGCSSGGVMTSSGGTTTCVFGTESSSNDSENRILVRWKLTSGQSITSMSFS